MIGHRRHHAGFVLVSILACTHLYFIIISGLFFPSIWNSLTPDAFARQRRAEEWSFQPHDSLPFNNNMYNDQFSESHTPIHDGSIQKDIIQPRAFEARPLDRFPCFLEDPATKWWKQQSKDLSPIQEGFFFLKTHKTGSSTGAGIHLRIARNMAARLVQNQQQGQVSQSSTNNKQKPPMCQVRFDHSTARKMKYGDRRKDRSFLWTILREPSERAISQFFHFEVSRKNIEATETNFEEFLLSKRSRTNGYYLRMLSLDNNNLTMAQTSRANMISRIQAIIDEYDFIAITERLDESAVALQMLLGLETGDILYLNAKSSGAYDAGGFQGKCSFIQPKNVTLGMRQFLDSPAWQARVEWDRLLYDAANKSLDITIDGLGREQFQQNLLRFQHAQMVAKEQCLSGNNITLAEVRFPCSASRNGLPPLRYSETNCLWKDSGCGTDCLDNVASQLGLWKPTDPTNSALQWNNPTYNDLT